MKTLLHICCAPCANQPIQVLRGDGVEVTGFWYNPNIHPYTEFRFRKNALVEYAKSIGLELRVHDEYGLRPFVQAVATNGLMVGESNKKFDLYRHVTRAQFAAVSVRAGKLN